MAEIPTTGNDSVENRIAAHRMYEEQQKRNACVNTRIQGCPVTLVRYRARRSSPLIAPERPERLARRSFWPHMGRRIPILSMGLCASWPMSPTFGVEVLTPGALSTR